MSRDSDIAQVFNARRERRRELKRQLGVPCTACRIREPKRHATLLLPGQTCYCGYRDPRQDERPRK